LWIVWLIPGKVAPAGQVRQVTLEVQKNGKWQAFRWFESTTDSLHDIVAPVSKTTGAYTIKYLAPNQVQPATIRLRVHVQHGTSNIDAVSTSWYVTRPTCT